MKITVGGKPVRPDEFGDAVMKAVFEDFISKLRERVGSIRRPDTGEFPTVNVAGDSFENASIRIEGSTPLLAIVKERLGPDAEGITFETQGEKTLPKAFLCYGSPDEVLASTIAHGLRASGIETWWAPWEIKAGDSLRQKIDAGLSGCTHFVALLTPDSIKRPWVNVEMDAAFMLKVRQQAVFIPLRSQLGVEQLPTLLAGMHSPEVNAAGSDLTQLINDIYGLTKKPPLGTPPASAGLPTTGYSPAASAIARVFVEKSEHGTFGDPQLTHEVLLSETRLTTNDLNDALHELRGMVRDRWDSATPRPDLFAAFDEFFRPWNPSKDALRLAADLVNDEQFPHQAAQIGARYGWPPRRLNPALTYLTSRGLVRNSESIAVHPWVTHWVQNTDATRRFVKSRA